MANLRQIRRREKTGGKWTAWLSSISQECKLRKIISFLK
jgi:hypothetical protein